MPLSESIYDTISFTPIPGFFDNFYDGVVSDTATGGYDSDPLSGNFVDVRLRHRAKVFSNSDSDKIRVGSVSMYIGFIPKTENKN